MNKYVEGLSSSRLLANEPQGGLELVRLFRLPDFFLLTFELGSFSQDPIT